MLCTISNRCEWALTIVRIMLGIIFIAHGAQKVLGLFGGSGLQGFVQWSATLGIPSWLAYCAAISELIAGILLVLGIASEIGALLVIGIMFGAIYFVHLKNGFFHSKWWLRVRFKFTRVCICSSYWRTGKSLSVVPVQNARLQMQKINFSYFLVVIKKGVL